MIPTSTSMSLSEVEVDSSVSSHRADDRHWSRPARSARPLDERGEKIRLGDDA